jgi:Rieske 2Fe-2S family protein
VTTFVKRTEIPLEGARTLPREYFCSPGIFAEEQEKIFGRRWLCVGRTERISKPGDYFVQEVGTESIIVLRDDGGSIRAFYNLCRHRGTRLCEAHSGQFSETIQCPYHSWAYGLDGRLIGAPSTQDIAGFNKADWPLHAVATGTWQGFLFVTLDENPEPVVAVLAPLDERVSMYNLPGLKVGREIVYDTKCNWKLLVQNYSECYHCSPVHPALAKLSPPTSGENDLIEGPLLGGYMELNEGKGSMTMSGRACGVAVSDLLADEANRVYYYSIFPNMLLSLHPDYVMFHTLWPIDSGHTRIVCNWMFHPETLARPEFDPDDGVAFWDMTNRQDWHICEESQIGVGSIKYLPGPYSARECLSAQFDREVLRSLGHRKD